MNWPGYEFWSSAWAEWYRAWADLAQGLMPQGWEPGPATPVADETLYPCMAFFVPSRGDAGSPPTAPFVATSPQDRELLACVTQAQLAAMGTLARSWSRVAQAWVEHGGRMTAATTSGGPGGVDHGARLRRLVDETRAYLRQVGDIAVDEARLLRLQMEGFAEQARRIIDDEPDPQAPPQRRARAKQ